MSSRAPTSALLAGALPIVPSARTCGEEVYIGTPASPAPESDAREGVGPRPT
ncbi:hypothetical protein ACFWBX_07610 [Streptomyces sp. NPDC059991]|uniref:hypothetical protein n=1 Tax=Streptomyces sp. NPDC059991 TaxID=3347028 RepID=UPI00369DB2AA